MNKYTPGPWKERGTMIYAPGERGGNICEISEPRATSYVAHTRLGIGSLDAAEAFANARLISKTPEIYGLLKEANTALADLEQFVTVAALYERIDNLIEWIEATQV